MASSAHDKDWHGPRVQQGTGYSSILVQTCENAGVRPCRRPETEINRPHNPPQTALYSPRNWPCNRSRVAGLNHKVATGGQFVGMSYPTGNPKMSHPLPEPQSQRLSTGFFSSSPSHRCSLQGHKIAQPRRRQGMWAGKTEKLCARSDLHP